MEKNQSSTELQLMDNEKHSRMFLSTGEHTEHPMHPHCMKRRVYDAQRTGQDGGGGRHTGSLPPMNTPKLQRNAEQRSLRTTGRPAARNSYNYKEEAMSGPTPLVWQLRNGRATAPGGPSRGEKGLNPTAGSPVWGRVWEEESP